MAKYRVYIIITCVLALLTIVGVFLVTTSVQKKLNVLLLDNYVEQEKVLAKSIAKTLEGEIRSTANLLTVLTHNETIRSAPTAACNREIKDILSRLKLGNIGRVGADGKFRCSANEALIGIPAANLGSYISDIFNDPEHKPVVSRSIKAPGVSGYLTAIHIPVWTDENEFDGTLGGALYLESFEEKYLKDIVFADRGSVVLFDDDGTILYHKNKDVIGSNIESPIFSRVVSDPAPLREMVKSASAGKAGLVDYINVTEGRKIGAFEPVHVLPGRNWIVLVTVPVADVQTELTSISGILSRIWQLAALIVAAIVAGSVLLSRNVIFKPLQQIQEMKTGFVSLVSHQLKTPVAQIKGFVDNMLDGLTGPLNDKQRDYLEDMRKVAEKNSKLIDDLLDISRLERGMLKISLEPLRLKDLMADVLIPLRFLANKKGVSLIERLEDSDLKILGDKIKTREAIRNIADNAIKFSPVGASVTVKVSEEPGYAVISITDEGEGIDTDVQNELFEKNRVWSGKVKASGAGLGLFLAKNFIELSGGIIKYSTAPHKGTTFYVKLKKITDQQ